MYFAELRRENFKQHFLQFRTRSHPHSVAERDRYYHLFTRHPNNDYIFSFKKLYIYI